MPTGIGCARRAPSGSRAQPGKSHVRDESSGLATRVRVAVAVCVACRALMAALDGRHGASALPATAPAAPARGAARPGWRLTALVAGLVRALAEASSGAVGALWASAMTSPPLLAAAVTIELHRHAGSAEDARCFRRILVVGLAQRSGFAAAVGGRVVPAGVGLAFAGALVRSRSLAWARALRPAQVAARMRFRSR